MNSVRIWSAIKFFGSLPLRKKFINRKLRTFSSINIICRSCGLIIPPRELSRYFDNVRTYTGDYKQEETKLEHGTTRLKTVLTQNKDKILNAEHKFRQKSEDILQKLKHQKEHFNEKKELYIQDFIDTKEKIKGKIGDFRENIYTIPNFLCISRILFSPYLGYVIVSEQYNVALILWLIASVTDVVDGWIARKWESQSSKLGSFLDPMADKVLVGTLFVTLTYNGQIPLALTVLIMTRDLILIIAGFVIRFQSLPPPRTFSRYFEVSNATAQLAPTVVSKINTMIQLLLVGCSLGAPVFDYVDHPAFFYLWIGTGISTVLSGLSYLTSKNTYKYLRKHNQH